MNTSAARYMTAIAVFLAPVIVLTFGTPRVARADSDGAKIIGGLVAGALVYELLDNDSDHYARVHYRYRDYGPDRYRYYYKPRKYRHRYHSPRYYDSYRYRSYDYYRPRYRDPYVYRYRDYGPYCYDRSGFGIEIHRGW